MNTKISRFYTDTATMLKQPKMVQMEVRKTSAKSLRSAPEVKVSRPVLKTSGSREGIA